MDTSDKDIKELDKSVKNHVIDAAGVRLCLWRMHSALFSQLNSYVARMRGARRAEPATGESQECPGILIFCP